MRSRTLVAILAVAAMLAAAPARASDTLLQWFSSAKAAAELAKTIEDNWRELEQIVPVMWQMAPICEQARCRDRNPWLEDTLGYRNTHVMSHVCQCCTMRSMQSVMSVARFINLEVTLNIRTRKDLQDVMNRTLALAEQLDPFELKRLNRDVKSLIDAFSDGTLRTCKMASDALNDALGRPRLY